MLDNENKVLKYTTNCLRDCPFVFLARPSDPGNGNIRIVMLEITKEQELQLDSGKSLLLQRGGLSFRIEPDFCLGYGELDLSPNSNDCIKIDNGDWDKRLYIRHFMPSEYDYNTHSVTSDIKGGRWYDTSRALTYLPYLYARMNKPKRVCIFKEYIDIVAMNRAKQKAAKQREWTKNNKEYLAKQRQKRTAAKRNAKLSLLTFNIKK